MNEAISTLLRWLVVVAAQLMKQCVWATLLALPDAWRQLEGILLPEQVAGFSAIVCVWAIGGAAYSGRVAKRAKPGKAMRMSATAVVRALSLLRRLGG